MKTALGKSCRDAASLIVLSKRGEVGVECCNYDVLLQTRTERASFGSSVVFPGGVVEAADASPDWIRLLEHFGYGPKHFEALHCAGSTVTPIFRDDPIRRHLTLRIAAIRETFEELGILICSRSHNREKSDIWAGVLPDTDVHEWQKRVNKNPNELLTLCKEFNCYPDVWSLHYLSNWLSPVYIPKRFDTAFFVTALQKRPHCLVENKEVAKVQWSTPTAVLSSCLNKEVLLYPPQSYELNRLARWPRVEELAAFLKEQSRYGSELYYHATVRAADGKLFVLPGDDLYPSNIDLNTVTVIESDKTVLQLRDSCEKAHRFELQNYKSHLVVKNFKPNNMDMGEKPIEILVALHK